jgi:hypothetical protein
LITPGARPSRISTTWALFVTAFGGIDNNNLTISLLVTEGSTGLDAADITFGGDGCRGHVTTDILSQATYNGWSLSRGPSRQQDGNYPAGLSATLWMTD